MDREMKFANEKARELYEKITTYRMRIDQIKRDEMTSDLYQLSLIWNNLSRGMQRMISTALAGSKSSEIEVTMDNLVELNKSY